MTGLLSSLIPLAVLGGVIYAIVKAVGRRSGDPIPPRDGNSVRRLFVYAMLFVALMVSTIGVSGLLGRVLDTAAARSDSELATTLALTLVGVPVFAALARWAWQRLAVTPTERDAAGWTLYLNAALVTSLAVTAGALVGVIVRAIDGTGYDGELLAMVIVWGAVWLGHWYAWVARPPLRGAYLHLLAGSGIGLGMLAAGVGIAITSVGDYGFTRASGDVISRGLGDDLMTSGVVAIVGAAIWVWHWWVHGLELERTRTWLAYVMLYGVLSGLVAAVLGAGRAVFVTLEWVFGDPAASSALVHFRSLSPAIAATVVGLAVWRYHGALVGPRPGRSRTDIDRIYDSIVAGTTLTTIAAAISILVVALFRLAEPAIASSADRGGDVLLAAVTLLIVGGPLWVLTWKRMQEHAHSGPEEAASPARRTYLFTILGVSGVVAFGALINLLVVLFQTWLGERTGGLNDPLQWPVALLVTTGAMAAYHFVIVRAERHLRTEEHRRDVILVWSGNGHAGDIASSTHADIRVLHRTDRPDVPVDYEAVARAIDAADGDHLIVLAGPDGIVVVPYE